MNDTIKIMVVGDIVGKPGRKLCRKIIADYRISNGIDFVICNGENAAGGMSITPDVAVELFDSGADVITTGNHVWGNSEIENIINSEKRLLRPANYPEGVPGRGYGLYQIYDITICVINLMGRVHMDPIDCPFKKFDAIYEAVKDSSDIIIIDFHAEATSEKRAMGWYVDGRASVLYGTHTHVQTSDEEIFPGGTGYITDLGMTGAFDSVIGMEKAGSISRFLTLKRIKFKVANGNPHLNGAIFVLNKEGRTLSIERLWL